MGHSQPPQHYHPHIMTQSANQDDPFDSLLTLEDSLYTTAYSQGVADGARAGRIEGRVFGLEKGFEKFAALGELHGRSVVWAGRLPQLRAHKQHLDDEEKETKTTAVEDQKKLLPLLPNNARLQNNITLLHSLTDTETFSTDNTEEAVADFDDRFKRAGAKAKVVERIVGESDHASTPKSPNGSPARGKGGPVRVVGEGRKRGGKGDDSMEDFAGSRLVR
ncbi:uncharacterized protein K460DRAFT_399789 [Cucurbitaria berberidis CBS 394.84]|uniref:Essential protein Yae1 N-terminal domain-containing protein n=1 Tax=Cucurbitaria berberidis CBS 394.84 TaxID=1168544 RepID=A0A9P4LD07_9PLEO|nr:uncharacterized protein K460DRAFT_399789 [Cucurbitaria berberidis CBS 394.84]KAF1849679.1 hypothetical protein K460DRAFT_399789 [Cucurbitaria berberidis CBS 394.84]